ncbi:MAG TPA: TRAP transporter small permease [Beijerinckiaceae bacterium]|mgnify:CR=1 FL=1|nr:TRAP transporter small permease [Beijerinckiaceae bacterium]
MSHRTGAVRRILDRLYLWGGYAAGAFLLITFVLMIVMSAGREVGLNVPSGDDFAAFSMAALAFLGLANVFKTGEMIRVGFLIERIHGPARRAIEIFCLSVGFAFIAYFAWNAFFFMRDSWRLHDMTSGAIAIPLWIPQISMVLGLTLLAIAMLDELIIVLSGRKPSYEKEPPKTKEELLERIIESGGV